MRNFLCLFFVLSVLTSAAIAQQAGVPENGNHVVGPEYQIDPDLTDKGNPKGKYFQFSMPLAESKIFRGDDKTLNPKKAVRKERKIYVYVPAQYRDGTEAPILVMHDGPSNMKLVLSLIHI